MPILIFIKNGISSALVLVLSLHKKKYLKDCQFRGKNPKFQILKFIAHSCRQSLCSVAKIQVLLVYNNCLNGTSHPLITRCVLILMHSGVSVHFYPGMQDWMNFSDELWTGCLHSPYIEIFSQKRDYASLARVNISLSIEKMPVEYISETSC